MNYVNSRTTLGLIMSVTTSERLLLQDFYELGIIIKVKRTLKPPYNNMTRNL